jgi:hypothetical protein
LPSEHKVDIVAVPRLRRSVAPVLVVNCKACCLRSSAIPKGCGDCSTTGRRDGFPVLASTGKVITVDFIDKLWKRASHKLGIA